METIDPLVSTLHLLQSAANNQECASRQSWDVLSKECNTQGGGHIDKKSFEARWEEDSQLAVPTLPELVASYDDFGITIKTDTAIQEPIPQQTDTESKWSKKARIGTRKHKD